MKTHVLIIVAMLTLAGSQRGNAQSTQQSQYNFVNTPTPRVLAWYELLMGVKIDGAETARGAITLTSEQPQTPDQVFTALTNSLQSVGITLVQNADGSLRVEQTEGDFSTRQPTTTGSSYIERRRARVAAGDTNAVAPSIREEDMQRHLAAYQQAVASKGLPPLPHKTEGENQKERASNHGLESTGAPPAAGTPETHP